MTGDKQTKVDIAREAWGTNCPDWVLALAECCDEHQSQRAAGDLVGYSNATVSLVLKNKYPGDLGKVETKVRGALLQETANCPVFGIINLKKCQEYRDRKHLSNTSMRVVLKRACKECVYSKGENDAV